MSGRQLTTEEYACACIYSAHAWLVYIWHTGTMKTLGKAEVMV